MASATAAAPLAACASVPEDGTSIDYGRAPPADWPELSVDVYHVTREEMASVCPRWYARLAAKKLIPSTATR